MTAGLRFLISPPMDGSKATHQISPLRMRPVRHRGFGPLVRLGFAYGISRHFLVGSHEFPVHDMRSDKIFYEPADAPAPDNAMQTVIHLFVDRDGELLLHGLLLHVEYTYIKSGVPKMQSPACSDYAEQVDAGTIAAGGRLILARRKRPGRPRPARPKAPADRRHRFVSHRIVLPAAAASVPGTDGSRGTHQTTICLRTFPQTGRSRLPSSDGSPVSPWRRARALWDSLRNRLSALRFAADGFEVLPENREKHLGVGYSRRS